MLPGGSAHSFFGDVFRPLALAKGVNYFSTDNMSTQALMALFMQGVHVAFVAVLDRLEASEAIFPRFFLQLTLSMYTWKSLAVCTSYDKVVPRPLPLPPRRSDPKGPSDLFSRASQVLRFSNAAHLASRA